MIIREAVRTGELTALKLMMSDKREQNTPLAETRNQSAGKLFYWLAAAQALQILIGAVLGLFVAPASLFVSRTENEAFAWLAAAFAGFASAILGTVSLPFSLVAAGGFRSEKKWRRKIGLIAAAFGILVFPLGTIPSFFLLRRIIKNS